MDKMFRIEKKNLGLKSPELKHGIKKFGVGMSCNLFKAFLESASPSLNFQFHFRHDEKKSFLMLEEECDRRVMGKKVLNSNRDYYKHDFDCGVSILGTQN